ncbi:GATA transcription factor 5-like [Mangifera indica]|uniref:GATA transcription factor 5-like n=1 Tax=Mangifera indica TaxID=29780 RepID=UPI001CFA5E1D|nr:GATA transcription factor 5-like [Mangifera indica]
MELCMGFERALKSSLRRELSLKSTHLHHQQVVFFDNLGCVSCDDFSVDDLLDFSNEEFQEFENEKDTLSVDSQDRVDDDNNSNSSFVSSSDQSLLTDELVEPVDEIAELEWVSRFVDDSSRSELSLLYPNYGEYGVEPVIKPVLDRTLCFPASFPSKARTKRPRRATRVWSLSSSPPNESSISSSSSSGSTITSPVQTSELYNTFIEPELKKPKKNPAVQSGASGGLFQRRCTHCQSQKTPQWRTGPLGPKTLCNACGVRFKSGRLFPEYRPACSPTFSGEIHSNSHRKVLEMRRKKEISGPEVGFSHRSTVFEGS